MARGDCRAQTTPYIVMATHVARVILLILLFSAHNMNGFNLDIESSATVRGPRDSYFGYAITLHENSDGRWLVVGAPRDNTTVRLDRALRPGALYKCMLSAVDSCQQMDLSRYASTEYLRGSQGNTELRDEQLLGAAVYSSGSKIMVCAPRWRDMKWQSEYAVNGACFTIDRSLDETKVTRLLMLTDNSVFSQWGTGSDLPFPRSFGMFGFSTHYSQDKFFLFGAPGMFDWRGGVVMYGGFKREVIPDTIDVNSYVGYSLTSGRFFGDGIVYHATGAPRSRYVGQVFIYSGNFQVKTVLSGRTLGSYFGGAVCAMDVNNDGRDDLLVGAPLFSDKVFDEGLVEVYISDQLGLLRRVEVGLRGSSKPRSRFGSAIASAGDLNLDGFPDALVGAPYEDDGRGAIYVYNGYREGVRPTPSQRLAASVLNNNMRGFGYALTAANMSYRYPVIKVTLSLTSNQDSIDHRTATCHIGGQAAVCYYVEVRAQYDGYEVPNVASFELQFKADVGKPDHARRTRLKDTSLTEKTLPLQRVRKSALVRARFDLVIVSHVADIMTPITFEASLTLRADDGTSILPPVLEQYDQHTKTLSIPFNLDCGDNKECHTDLSVVASVRWFPKQRYVILGDRRDLTVNFLVTNSGEAAYLSELTVVHPRHLSYKRTTTGTFDHVACAPRSPATYPANATTREILCDVGHPMGPKENKTFLIVFQQYQHAHIVSNPKYYIIQSNLQTQSNDTNLDNNEFYLKLPVRIQVTLAATGSSSPHTYFLAEEQGTNTSRDHMTEVVGKPEVAEVDHVFDIRNQGPGLHPAGAVNIGVPVMLGSVVLVRNVTVKGTVSAEGQETTLNCDHLPDPVTQGGAGGAAETEQFLLERFQAPYVLDCARARCRKWQCDVTPLPVDGALTITVSMTVELEPVRMLESKGPVQLMTEATLTHSSHLPSVVFGKSTAQAMTFFESRGEVTFVPAWVLIVTIIAGILLLLLIIGILYKVGFFKRPQKEEMDRLLSGEPAPKAEPEENGALVDDDLY